MNRRNLSKIRRDQPTITTKQYKKWVKNPIGDCSGITRQGKPCPIPADRSRDGKYFCHVHDPMGTYRQQVSGRRAQRIKRQNQPDPSYKPPDGKIESTWLDPVETCPFQPGSAHGYPQDQPDVYELVAQMPEHEQHDLFEYLGTLLGRNPI